MAGRRIAWNINTEGYANIGFGVETMPGPAGGGTLTVTSSLYINGIAKLPIADISGHNIHRNPQQATGIDDGLTDGARTAGIEDDDILWMGPGQVNTALIWDERATTHNGSPGGFRDLYNTSGSGGANYRNGLPGGQPGQEVESIEIIRGGDQDSTVNSNDSFSHDFINLSHNSTLGGTAYNLDITIDVGMGRDLVVAGEGNDVIYGGDENLGLGDGLLGMGGNDTIYGGINNSSHSITGARGADDLFGYMGNDTLYGFNDGDVYYGDAGNDVIFMPGSALTNDVLGLFAAANTPANAILAFSTATAFGGDGADTIFASRLNDSNSADLIHERFFGGNVPTTWYDKEYFDSANGLDNSGDDTVSYQFVSNAQSIGINIDLRAANNEVFNDPDTGLNSTLSYGRGFNVTVGGNTFASAGSNDRFFGIEHIVGTQYNDTVQGSSAANRFYGGLANDTLLGDAGSDTLVGGAGDDRIDAGADNDLVEGGAGADSLTGGSGIDTLSYFSSAAAVTVTLGGSGTGGDADLDTLGTDFEILVGSDAGGDRLVGDGNTNTIYGAGGVDTIDGGVGNVADLLFGGGGDFLSFASITVGGVGVTASLVAGTASGSATGTDTFSGFEHIIGTSFNDVLTGDGAVNSLVGGDGNDTLFGGTRDDLLFGGTGDDTAVGGAGGDSMVGGGATNGDWLSYQGSAAVQVALDGTTIAGGDAAGDTFSGFANLIGSGNGDTLRGDTNANTIQGGLGIDTIDGGAGNVADRLEGGGDGDFLSYRSITVAGSTITASLTAGTATGSAGLDSFTGFRHILGSDQVDILTGNNETVGNSLVGNAGNDVLSGLGGVDTLFGGTGEDTLIAGSGATTSGNTTIVGWDGDVNHTLVVTSGANRVDDFAFGGDGSLDAFDVRQSTGRNIFSPLAAGSMAGIEIIIAGAAADVINLTLASNGIAESVTVFGGAENDVVFSGNGNDLIVGGRNDNTVATVEGSDTLFGGLGNDIILGDDSNSRQFGGNDTLFGGQGTDSLVGGLGNDTVYGGADQDTLDGDDGNDMLFDGDDDKLFGGLGNDLLVMQSNNFSASEGELYGGADNDSVFVSGQYAKVDSDLGAGADKFISYAIDGDLNTGRADNVRGGTGNDIISAWYGSDVLYGDDSVGSAGGDDIIWGGAGVDTIYGGEGTDILYGGSGDGDLLVGGAGIDYYYWARGDGDDRIEDRDNGTISGGQGENYIVVFPAFAFDASDADGLVDGQGVADPDRDIYDNDDTDGFGDDEVMIELADPGGDETLYYLHVLNADGSVNQSMLFDRDEISVIMLWNNDATGSTPVVTGYRWVEDEMDPLGGRYQPV